MEIENLWNQISIIFLGITYSNNSQYKTDPLHNKLSELI